ncbi:RDD family protein [Sphingobacterium sp. SYP-B4668]|uniref:RDD family protein n=1 Tax=Sphingobacterium sp. SYP-B4668 TaxID=2996035 RepID=UPI0022DE2B70|nr:RDD family protein [Sphingobacterium sp. SYP-B4668]
MNKLLINTPQNVKFEYNLATLGARILAFGIDQLIIISYMLLMLFLLLYSGVFNLSDSWTTFGLYSLFSLPALFYPLILETFLSGQTLGKKLMHLKVVKIDGTRATAYQYFIRWVCSIIDVFLCFGAIGLSSIILSKKGQRIGDLAAETTVISTKVNTTLNHTLFAEITTERSLTYPQVIKLSDFDANAIKDIFDKGYKRKDYNIILALATRIEELLGVKREKSPEEFIDTVIKDHYALFRDK